MGVFSAAGARLTKAAVLAAVTTVGDPEVIVNADLFDTRSYSDKDGKPEGSIRRLLARAGSTLRTSQLNALFPTGTVTAISPVSGVAAGGTVLTITGTNLDGSTGVTFGGTAGTAFTVVSATSVKVTTPAKAAGAVAVAIADDSGTVTQANGYTFV